MSQMHKARVYETFPVLDQWRTRVRDPYFPHPESVLATDDTDWPWLSVSHLAVSSMAAAGDHLQAVRVQIENDDYYPFAQGSLLRTAMLGAAQAVWILFPEERAKRLKNARTLAAEMYKQHGLFLKDAQRLSDEPHEGTDKTREHVSKRCHELADKRAAAGETAEWGATSVIEQVNRWSFAGGDRAAVEGRYWWRLGSGAAHGLQWSVLGQRHTQQTGDPDADGIAPFTVTPDLDSLAQPYILTFELLRHAWLLLDRRGSDPSKSPEASATD